MRMNPKTEALAKIVKSLLAEQRRLVEKEKGLVRTLNNVLGKIGYELVKTDSNALPVRKRRRRRGRKPGRPRRRRTSVAASAVKPKWRGRPLKK